MFGQLLGLGKSRNGLEARLDSETSTFVLKVQETSVPLAPGTTMSPTARVKRDAGEEPLGVFYLKPQKDALFYRGRSSQSFHYYTCVPARRISEVFELFCSPFWDGGPVVLPACDFGRLLSATWSRGERFICRDLNGHSPPRFATVAGWVSRCETRSTQAIMDGPPGALGAQGAHFALTATNDPRRRGVGRLGCSHAAHQG